MRVHDRLPPKAGAAYEGDRRREERRGRARSRQAGGRDGDDEDDEAAPRCPDRLLDRVKVLVLEDDPDSCDLLDTFLATCGADVRILASALDGRHMFTSVLTQKRR